MGETKKGTVCGKELSVYKSCIAKKASETRYKNLKINNRGYSDPEFDGKSPREVQDIIARAAKWLNNYGGFTCEVSLRYEKTISDDVRQSQIKGLSRYYFIETGNELVVISRKTGSKLKKRHDGYYTLKVDSEKRWYKHYSEGFLKFLLKNPEIDALQINPKDLKITFNSDGTVRSYKGKGEKKKPYHIFKDVDDAISTVLIMKAAQKGDLCLLYEFINENKVYAAYTTAKILKIDPKRIIRFSNESVDLFIEQVKTAHCGKIIPLYAWLCKCFKIEFLKSSKTLRILGDDQITDQ